MTITVKEAFEHPEWISGKFLKVSDLVTPKSFKATFTHYYSAVSYDSSGIGNNMLSNKLRKLKSNENCVIIKHEDWVDEDGSVSRRISIENNIPAFLYDHTYAGEKVKIETFVTIITEEEFKNVLDEAFKSFMNYDQRTT